MTRVLENIKIGSAAITHTIFDVVTQFIEKTKRCFTFEANFWSFFPIELPFDLIYEPKKCFSKVEHGRPFDIHCVTYKCAGPLGHEVTGDVIRSKGRSHVSEIGSVPSEHIWHGRWERSVPDLCVSWVEVTNRLHHSLYNTFTRIFNDSFKAACNGFKINVVHLVNRYSSKNVQTWN